MTLDDLHHLLDAYAPDDPMRAAIRRAFHNNPEDPPEPDPRPRDALTNELIRFRATTTLNGTVLNRDPLRPNPFRK